VGFAHYLAGLEAEKLENVWITDIQPQFCFFRRTVGQPGKFLFVFRKSGALEVEAAYLPFEFTNRPASLDAFDLVKGTLERVVNPDQLGEMAERQKKNHVSGVFPDSGEGVGALEDLGDTVSRIAGFVVTGMRFLNSGVAVSQMSG
jgi:hypothetical protein